MSHRTKNEQLLEEKLVVECFLKKLKDKLLFTCRKNNDRIGDLLLQRWQSGLRAVAHDLFIIGQTAKTPQRWNHF